MLMRKTLDKKRWQAFERGGRAVSESAGQQLSLEEQERASLRRIMLEMGHRGGRQAPRNRRLK
jgi:hypothetical protein